ncbi:hypothetical protein Cpin_0400 [Chitinophaga pinensis DSM 2588]|uniref:Uncharacterized protein n=1 Tax=Chitinophaga pinensis (strain ATCC 43595 / DSM 2588 / LMG 13176 / NBRC 15968 / NCIMB 11800 / UQM 2034) TaxID=485918 RepID=A0A979FZK5_CHIPD|nr:hypothetical protein Cpin_0400 [Chitinophaga pinensis DSM 2588]
MVKSDKEAYKEDRDRYQPIVIQRNTNIPGSVFVFGKSNDQIGKRNDPSLYQPLATNPTI